MSTLVRRLVLVLLGMLAGAAAWPLIELLLANQVFFPSYLIFSSVTGAVFGFVLGAFFGSGEGIIVSVTGRIIRGALTGMATGLVGGIIGFLAGQGALFLMGNYLFRSTYQLDRFAFSIARGIGWAVLGIFVGISEGIRARSAKKVLVGFLGGLIGGAIGGFVLEYARVIFPTIGFARLVGLVLFGLFVGLAYGLIEKKLSFGVLRVLNGEMKGKEYIIGQNSMWIGNTPANEIALRGYDGVEDRHAVLKIHGDDVVIERASGREVLVNDDPVDRRALKFEDVVKIGTAKFYYRYE